MSKLITYTPRFYSAKKITTQIENYIAQSLAQHSEGALEEATSNIEALQSAFGRLCEKLSGNVLSAQDILDIAGDGDTLSDD